MENDERRKLLVERLENILLILLKTTETKAYSGDNGITEWIQAIAFTNNFIEDLKDWRA